MLNKKNTGPRVRAKPDTAMFLIACMFFLGTIIACACGIPVKRVMQGYSYDVLVILIVMELFTNLIVETGVMQMLAIRIADLSQGRKRLCLMMFGLLMFLISSLLNNITAVMMVLPIVFVLLKSLDVDKRYVYIFFCTILALSNTGGAASPIGDFPAIVIMTSGITSFLGYLTHLLTDVAWIRDVYEPSKEKFSSLRTTEGPNFIWKLKEDWYDLDYKYLRDHPGFRAFRVYLGAVGFQNNFMEEFSEDAFDNRRIYITDFYLQGKDGLDREYPCLHRKYAVPMECLLCMSSRF